MAYHPANADFVASLSAELPDGRIRSADARYLTEPRGRWSGTAAPVVLPRTTEEVAQIIRACNAAGVAVLPYAGGTGLVGGQVAPEPAAPLILSVEAMTAIRSIHPLENVAVVEAGAILADVHDATQAQDRLFPLSLASEGSARIGGLLATNAGGVGVLRYGNARDLCLGLEAVLPDGSIWNGLKRLRKDNTGYDLRNLLIGSEGTLGMITAATLKLFPRPAAQGTGVFVVSDPSAALRVLSLARDIIGDGVSAFELISGIGLDFLKETLPDIRRPFDPHPNWLVLIDLGLGAGQDPQAVLTDLFEAALQDALVSDGLIAQSQSQRAQFWSVREHIPEANRRIGSVSSHDISVPLGSIAEFIIEAGQVIADIGDFRINCFGHLGDGNLHYNVFPQTGFSRADHMEERDQVKQALHDLVHAYDGSVSAEHGIGRLKVADLERYGDPAKLAAMRAIKSALDPNGIMNPGAILR